MHANSFPDDSVWGRRTHFALKVLFPFLLVAGLFIRVDLFETSVRTLQPSSDESIAALLAVSIRNGATPLLFLAQPYLFPIESYLAAPFAHFLTPDALGVRLPTLLLHLLTLAVQLALVRSLFRERLSRLLGYALLLMPAPYVLMVQSMFSMPGYAFLLFSGFVILWLAEGLDRSPKPAGRLALIGFLGGIGWGSHQLIAVFLIPAILVVLLEKTAISKIRCSLLIVAGLAIGLIPYILARWRFPGAHEAVENLLPFDKIMARLWSPALTHTWPVALGWRLCLFPDQTAVPSFSTAMEKCFAPLLLAFLLVGSMAALRERIHALTTERWRPSIRDAAWLIAFLNLLFFAISERANSASYRYLLPAAAVFPYLVADLAERLPCLRLIMAGAATILLVINVARYSQLERLWNVPDFAEKVASIPDLRPALDALRSLGIRHAVASYGAAYRINWQSRGEVVCAQPSNERFPHWPYPFVDKVWSGEPVAYVLTDAIRFLKPALFEMHLKAQEVEATVITAGAFRVYHDFRPLRPLRADRRLDPRSIRIDASENKERSAFLHDGDLFTTWTTTNLMTGREWVEAHWGTTQAIERVVLAHGRFGRDIPNTYRVLLLNSTNPPALVDAKLDFFELDRGRPRYGRSVQSFRFDGAEAEGIRFEIAERRKNRNWTLAEFEVYVSERAPEEAVPP